MTFGQFSLIKIYIKQVYFFCLVTKLKKKNYDDFEYVEKTVCKSMEQKDQYT